MKSCSDIMTSNPAFCLATDTVEKAVKLMKSEDVGAIPIVEDDASARLVGILTDRDIVMNLDHRGDILDRRIEEIMTPETFTCYEEEALEKALNTMESHQVRRVPIIDHKKRLLGMISQADLATRVQEPEKLAEVMQEISKPM